MNSIAAKDILEATNGTLRSGELSVEVSRVSTDTRKDASSSVFFPLVGENFDAHDYLDKAIENGAEILVCERLPEGLEVGNTVVIQVEDSLIALQRFAAWYRKQLSLQVVGITGSNGKTSTKDFTRGVLAAAFEVDATVGNLNNHIGLPLTVLSADSKTEAGVWEMGMNHPGEIAPLCQIAAPRIGVITNIGTAHIEHMGSRDAIAEEKGVLARALPEDGVLVVPASCDYIEYFRERTKAKLLVVGNGRGIVRAESLKVTPEGSEFNLIIEGQDPVAVKLAVVGKHMVTNALLAAGVGHVLGMEAPQIAAALSEAELTSGRLESFVSAGVRVIDDTYNANPESVRAAIDTLAEMQLSENGQRYVVLGKMAELGEHASKAYLELGTHGAELGLHVVSVGDEAKEIYQGATQRGKQATHFSSVEDASAWLKLTCKAGDAVLFKGSRAAAMERVMQQAFSN